MSSLPDKSRISGSLLGMLVGDALAMPVHWFYSPEKLRKDYGDLTGLVAPKRNHAESMVKGMSYTGTIDILHDKAVYYAGFTAASSKAKTKEEIDALRDDHGNFVGAKADERPHYHGSLKKGQNTVNVCLARLLMRYLGDKNAGKQDRYDPDEYLSEKFVKYMTTPPDNDELDQTSFHNDTYLDVFMRGFFATYSGGKVALRNCALSQRDTWSIGSLDGVVLSLPMIAAYADEPDYFIVGRAVEHSQLTHRSITVTAVISVLVPLMSKLYRGVELRTALDSALEHMRPPKATGRSMCDSYVSHQGPGNIPKYEKFLQHMETTEESSKDLIHKLVADETISDQDVAGWGDQPNSRFSTACYCEQTIHVVFYLAYKYHHDPQKALLQNAMLGGHSTARGAILGAIMGAAHGEDALPFAGDLAAAAVVKNEINALLETV